MKNVLSICFVIIASVAQAIDSQGVLPLLVQVVNTSGEPIEGATVSLSQAEIEKLKRAAGALGLSTSAVEHACRSVPTDKIGFALIYYSGGMQLTSMDYSCTLPSSIEISRHGKPTFTINLLKRGNLSIKPNEPVAPHIIATLKEK